MKLRITTPSFEQYTINSLGQIQRNDIQNTPSNSWKMAGIVHVKRNYFIPFSEITKERIDSLELLYKNGNPQYTVRDIDHGTTREWGNTKFHGIKSITFINE